MWSGFPEVEWRYYSQPQLQRFLLERIEEGYTFPLNPKWVLCDEGWWDVYEALRRKGGDGFDAWFPPGSGLRERIAEVREAHGEGFARRVPDSLPLDERMAFLSDKLDFDMAELQLRRHLVLLRARMRLRALLGFRSGGKRQAAARGSE